ncbi:Sortase family protein [Clostridium liquoris]|uniref:Sortase family protein n=1 Tax=Clostridium liquoris TaxID=1289519 RepID=A0A2T0B582_9CLOT|nr:class D sortase [Clostridium liquoris]PRR79051.1 Sortase family protein [Clostridium liquoris]
MKRRVISTLTIIIGLVLLVYPKVSEVYNNYQQKKIVKEWQQSLGSSEEIMDNGVGSILPGSLESDKDSGDEEEKNRKNEKKLTEGYTKKNIKGMLKIEKINLNLPILSGAIEENLKISVASIEHTGNAGEFGNYAIAGHRSRTYGRNFNRLEEVEIGDIIEVDKGEKIYKYTVVEKLFVKPEETWVLNNNKNIKGITLVTCHPMVDNPTHRLIIKGKILD